MQGKVNRILAATAEEDGDAANPTTSKDFIVINEVDRFSLLTSLL